MPYEQLTATRFKELKPGFKCVSDLDIEAYIDLASLFVGEHWPESVYEKAWVAATCHLLTLDGLGSSAASQSFANGTAQFHSIKSGELTLTRFQAAAGNSTYSQWLGQTPCGAFYYQLLRMAMSGPRVVSGAVRAGNSGYAKDWPLGTGGWPSWWWSGQ